MEAIVRRPSRTPNPRPRTGARLLASVLASGLSAATVSPAHAQTPGAGNTITDVPGIEVGHYERVGDGYRTGTTVLLTGAGATASVDVQGGAPGTRETDLLAPGGLVTEIHALVLSGGSAYGLDAAAGVMRWLEERERGFPIAGGVVPIVPAAILFDLGRGGDFSKRPDASLRRPSAFEVCRMFGPTQVAASIATRVVCPCTSDTSPPMMPARLVGPSASEMSAMPALSLRSTSSSVLYTWGERRRPGPMRAAPTPCSR
ncbi:MAG: P1 family peptidase [Gemmatimonadetes bacterium]|nr:P1 family peptidase [Gemmatimonadota bacterium]